MQIVWELSPLMISETRITRSQNARLFSVIQHSVVHVCLCVEENPLDRHSGIAQRALESIKIWGAAEIKGEPKARARERKKREAETHFFAEFMSNNHS